MRARLAAALFLALVAGGCGGGPQKRLTHDEYQAKIRAVVRDAEPAGRLFSEVVWQGGPGNPKTVAECGRKAAQLHDELRRIVNEVDALDPPADAADLQRRFVANARVSVASVGRAADAAARGDLHCGGEMNRRIYGLPSTGRAEQAVTELEQRGYVVFGE